MTSRAPAVMTRISCLIFIGDPGQRLMRTMPAAQDHPARRGKLSEDHRAASTMGRPPGGPSRSHPARAASARRTSVLAYRLARDRLAPTGAGQADRRAGWPGCAAPSEKALRDLRRRLGPAPLKVVAQLDGVDVLEDLAAAETVSQPIEQPASGIGGLLAPVADEDPARRGRGGSSHWPPPPKAQPSLPLTIIIEGASGRAQGGGV
jgi:hypothetical protein